MVHEFFNSPSIDIFTLAAIRKEVKLENYPTLFSKKCFVRSYNKCTLREWRPPSGPLFFDPPKAGTLRARLSTRFNLTF